MIAVRGITTVAELGIRLIIAVPRAVYTGQHLQFAAVGPCDDINSDIPRMRPFGFVATMTDLGIGTMKGPCMNPEIICQRDRNIPGVSSAGAVVIRTFRLVPPVPQLGIGTFLVALHRIVFHCRDRTGDNRVEANDATSIIDIPHRVSVLVHENTAIVR